MQTPSLRKPNPLLVSPVEMRAATLPYTGDSEQTEQRRASLATNLRNVGYAAMVLTAGVTATGISEHNHSPYSTLSALVAVVGASRLAYTYMQAGITTSALIATGHAETFEQMVVLPGDPALGPQLPSIPPSAE